jgi:hypothetical protein
MRHRHDDRRQSVPSRYRRVVVASPLCPRVVRPTAVRTRRSAGSIVGSRLSARWRPSLRGGAHRLPQTGPGARPRRAGPGPSSPLVIGAGPRRSGDNVRSDLQPQRSPWPDFWSTVTPVTPARLPPSLMRGDAWSHLCTPDGIVGGVQACLSARACRVSLCTAFRQKNACAVMKPASLTTEGGGRGDVENESSRDLLGPSHERTDPRLEHGSARLGGPLCARSAYRGLLPCEKRDQPLE